MQRHLLLLCRRGVLCQFLVRTATFKNAYVGDKEEDGTLEESSDDKYAKVKPNYAYGVLKQGLELYKSILIIDVAERLSIAWNSIITIPIPYLGIMRCLDLALCVPVRIFEGKHGGENLKRSTELMLGRKMLLLKTFFYVVSNRIERRRIDHWIIRPSRAKLSDRLTSTGWC